MEEKLRQFAQDFTNHLLNVKNVLICLQKGNDMDTTTSGLALAKLIELNHPDKSIKIIQINVKKNSFMDLSKYDYDEAIEKMNPKETLFVAVDINSTKQISNPTYLAAKDCYLAIKIDHHDESEPLSTEEFKFEELHLVLPDYSSCAEVIWDLAKAMSWKTTAEIAEIVFYGLYADSMAFTSKKLSYKTFQRSSEMVKKGANAEKVIRNLTTREYKQIMLICDVLKESECQGNLVCLNLRPEIVYQYYPENFKKIEKRKIRQRKLITFPLNTIEGIMKANVFIYIHYSLISPFNNSLRYVFVIVVKPNEDLERLLLANGFFRNRNRFSRPMKFEELLTLIEKNKELLTK